MATEFDSIKSRLLKRQIRKHLKGFSEDELERMKKFVLSVSDEYNDMSEDRLLLERSLDISSDELSKKNDQLTVVLQKNIGMNEKLEESMNNLSHIVDSLGEGLVVIDSNRKIVVSNSRASIITGYPKELLIGKNYSDVLCFCDDKGECSSDDFIEQTLQTGKEFIINRDIVLSGFQDSKTPVSVIASPLEKFSTDGMSCVLVFRDATKERELDNLKNEFLSVASHELRTPMTVIKGYVSLLKRGKLGDINEKQSNYLEKIFTNTTQLIEMVNDMLDVNKLEAGKMEFCYDTFSISKLLEGVIADMQGLVKKKNIILTGDINNLIVYSDKRKIEQVMINFISNAYKFTQEGGRIDVILEADTKSDFLQISIKDSGQGIEKEHIGKLFQKFSQVGSHLNKTEKGTGLGLSICKKIAEGLKGEVGVESVFGEGSTFYIKLPINSQKIDTKKTES